ncbi:hypothetical protein BDC45DRAFT_610006 [Circinella umbellata]|nr:hypothetical protein BDC45DRAFT_610006 [Circinella umbellata]
MSNCVLPSVDNKQRRVFSPVILFHDHRFIRDGSGDLEHVHIPYRDPHYVPSIESSKKRIYQMLEDNGRFWTDVMMACSKDTTTTHKTTTDNNNKPLSPVPSLVSSSSPTSVTPKEPSQEYRLVPSSSTSSTSSSSSSSSPSPSSSSQQQTTLNERRPYQRRSHPPTMHVSRQKRTRKSTSVIQTGQLSSVQQQQQKRNHYNNNNNNKSSASTSTNGIKKRQRSNLPKPVTAILKTWLTEHKEHPYPNEDEKIALVQKTGLARNQISNWFINARRRILRPMLIADDVEVEEEEYPQEGYSSYKRRISSTSTSSNLSRRNSSSHIINRTD